MEAEIRAVEAAEWARRLKRHQGYRNLLKVKWIGPVLGAVFIAEIGDITGFPRRAGVLGRVGPAALPVRHHRAT